MQNPLSRGAHRALKFIKSYDFQKRGWSCPRQETLAKDLCVDQRTVKRYVAELVAKRYLSATRRPNSSSIYRFGLRSGQNVPTKGTQNVPADVPADVPTIQLFLKQTNAPPSDQPRTPKTRIAHMEMPDYYTTPNDRKLWSMAARWIQLNNPDLSAIGGDKAAPIMHALEMAGALQLAEDAPLPMIAWPALQALPIIVPPARKPPTREDLERLGDAIRRLKA